MYLTIKHITSKEKNSKAMLSRCLCIFIAMVFSITAFCQDIKITTSIDKPTYTIGDYIHLNITVENPSGYVLNLPAPESIASFDIISASPVDTILEAEKNKYHQEIIYSVYDSGNYAIPIINVHYKKPGDTADYFAVSDSIPFAVNTVSVDTTLAIKPIKAPMDVTVKNYLWLYIAGGILILLIIVYLISRILKKRRLNRSPIEIKLTPQSLYESIVGRLKQLDEKKLWQKDEIKNYYSELTDILRDYIEHSYNMPAMESTSDEIINQLSHARIPIQQINDFQYIADLADMAKFAKSRPLAAENTTALELAFQFVEATKQISETPLNTEDKTA